MLIINNELYNQNYISLDLDSPWLQFGRAVFTSGIYHNKIYFWHEHKARLQQSIAHILGEEFLALADENFWQELKDSFQLYEYLPLDKSKKYKFKIYLFSDSIKNLKQHNASAKRLNYCIQLKTFEKKTAAYKLAVLQNSEYMFSSFLAQFKTCNYLVNELVLEAFKKQQDIDDVLKLSSDFKVLECVRSNIYFVKNKKIFSPRLGQILPGTQRQLLFQPDFFTNSGYEIIEKDIFYQDVASYDAVFISNSVQGFCSVASIDTHSFKLDSYLQNWVQQKLEELS